MDGCGRMWTGVDVWRFDSVDACGLVWTVMDISGQGEWLWLPTG